MPRHKFTSDEVKEIHRKRKERRKKRILELSQKKNHVTGDDLFKFLELKVKN